MMKLSLFIILLIIGLFAQTEASGNLGSTPEDTLTKDPSVEVRFNGNYKPDVFGSLFAIVTN